MMSPASLEGYGLSLSSISRGRHVEAEAGVEAGTSCTWPPYLHTRSCEKRFKIV